MEKGGGGGGDGGGEESDTVLTVKDSGKETGFVLLGIIVRVKCALWS